MELNTIIKKRLNVKKYTSEKPPIENIINAINSANQTPSPGNINVLTYIIVEDPEIITEISKACQQSFIEEAPYVIVVTANQKQLKRLFDNKAKQYLKHYIGAAIQNLTLKITELGLASCWIETFSELTIKNNLNIPDIQDIEVILTIGYELGKSHSRRKPALINKVFFGKWGNKFHKPFVKVSRKDV